VWSLASSLKFRVPLLASLKEWFDCVRNSPIFLRVRDLLDLRYSILFGLAADVADRNVPIAIGFGFASQTIPQFRYLTDND
jgi:hypothetical protein